MEAHCGAIYTADQVRELDRRAIQDLGIPGYTLMTRAGHAALDALRAAWPAARTVAVLCGPGNNGGDGYVVARAARAAGLSVRVVALTDPAALAGDARRAYRDFRDAGATTLELAAALEGADVVVDAMLGTGLVRDVTGPIRRAIEACNAAGRPVLAVDVPSGLHADTGAVLGEAVRAAVTVSFIGRKLGCYVGAGPDRVGRLVFADLEVPAEAHAGMAPAARLIDPEEIASALPVRPRDAHKGSHGHVLVVGGALGMPGAARLAGEAALRAGAGLVTVAVQPGSAAAVVAGRPELMCFEAASAEALGPALERASVVAIGPGLGRSGWSRAVYERALAAGLPTVVDADALNLLAEQPRRSDRWVLTPHPGEAARLLGRSTGDVQADRPGAASALAARYGGTVVLKGAGSIVLSSGAPPWICDRGNPGMATGGMGDVLTGLVAGVAAQCRDAPLAARIGVLVHAMAGDRAAARGERGLVATDVLDEVRACVNPPPCG